VSARAEALHLLEQLDRWRSMPAAELVLLFVCPTCRAAPNEPCRTPAGRLVSELRWRPHHVRRAGAVINAQDSKRLRIALDGLRANPVEGLYQVQLCWLYRRLAAAGVLLELPHARCDTPVQLARAGSLLRAALRARAMWSSHDNQPLSDDNRALVHQVLWRRELGLGFLPEEGTC